MKFTITERHLAMAAMATHLDRSMQGLLVRGGCATATNGHCAVRIPIECEDVPDEGVMLRFGRIARRLLPVEVVISAPPEGDKWTPHAVLVQSSVAILVETRRPKDYPDVDAVVPADPGPVVVCLDPALLTVLASIVGSPIGARGQGVRLRQGADPLGTITVEPSRGSLPAGCLCLLSPVRSEP